MAGSGGGGQLFVMNADGSGEQQLTFKGRVNEDPAWSPDGREIVFQSSRNGRFEIYTLDVEGALLEGGDPKLRRLTETDEGDYWPSWGPAAPGDVIVTSMAFEKSPQIFASVPTWEIALADLDGDGDLNAVFANAQREPSQVWLNDGRGFYRNTGQELRNYGHGIGVGDGDGDGDLDLVITTHQSWGASMLYLNDGQAQFQLLEPAFEQNIGFSANLLDVDGDGDLDAVGEGSASTRLFINDGAGNFQLSELRFPKVTVWGDLDSDGDPDVFAKEEGTGYAVLSSQGPAPAGGPSKCTQLWHYSDPEAMAIGDMETVTSLGHQTRSVAR